MVKKENIKKGEKFMNYIELESNGSLVTNEGIVFPIDCSEAPETASDAEEMMGVHILDTDTEWWESMSCQDAVRLFPFLANITEVYNTEGYLKWAVEMGDLVAESNNQMSLYGASIEEGWDWTEAVDGWKQLPSQNLLGGTI